MLALTKAGESVALRKVPDPVPLSHEAIVRVNTFALTHRDLVDLTDPTGFRGIRDGAVLGRDFAGSLVEYPAALEPTATMRAVQGARVVGTVRRGAWAELVAVPYTRLAGLPDNVADVQACTLPTPGLAALRSLQLGGFLVGKQVLVTGARGGVGRLACQLAHLAGADVVAFVRPGQRAPRSYRPLDQVPGADRVTEHLPGRFDLIIETVGGDIFGEAVEYLEPGGLLVEVATPELRGRVSFRTWRVDRSAGARVQFLDEYDDVTARDAIHTDLRRLVELVAAFKLDVGVAVEDSWGTARELIQGVRERRITGRVVLRPR
jgi:NADPH:quinone reductase